MALIYVRSILAIVLCLAGALAYWFGYSAILRGDAFGVPFGWGFGTALSIGLLSVPLALDRDDPAITLATAVANAAFLVVASGIWGAGAVLHGSLQFAIGTGIGGAIGLFLGYWAFGEDRKKRGCPRR